MFPDPVFVDTNGVRLAVYEQGSGPPVVLLHGFPELAFSWRHQLPALADAGFRAIAPDLRGYGRSDAPKAVEAYAIDELVADVTGLLDVFEIETAVIVGHDWGALIAWHLAMTMPQRIERLIALNVPHIPPPPTDPIALMRERFGDDFYIVNFQDSDEADRLFDEDPGRVFDRLMRRNTISRKRYDALPTASKVPSLLRMVEAGDAAGEPLLSADERNFYASAFEHSGFTGPINWYRNWTRNWQRLDGIDPVIRVPVLFIGAVDDVIIAPEYIENMHRFVPDLEVHMLERTGHWSQQERPEEVNRIMLRWLGNQARD
jgi:pimeloyl-ACP methyl ester carboxylesterase